MASEIESIGIGLPSPQAVPRRGVVRRYGTDTGWGVVETSDGLSLPFHATAIADQSRRIDDGQAVVFVIAGGREGRWEATGLVAI